jgi:hypothetical protein
MRRVDSAAGTKDGSPRTNVTPCTNPSQPTFGAPASRDPCAVACAWISVKDKARGVHRAPCSTLMCVLGLGFPVKTLPMVGDALDLPGQRRILAYSCQTLAILAE